MISDDANFEKYVPKPEVLNEEDGMFDHLSEEDKKSDGASSMSSSKMRMLDNRSSYRSSRNSEAAMKQEFMNTFAHNVYTHADADFFFRQFKKDKDKVCHNCLQ